VARQEERAVVSQDLDTDLASYAPAKHQWDAGDIDELDGVPVYSLVNVVRVGDD
jgi:orotate phosphoribosyltransferase-like protein